jgi:predicted MFS family arabinose efflux permease
MTDAAAPAFSGFASKNYRAYVLGVLVVIYTFNFIDRILIGIVGEKIKEDLNIGDLELGLLGGTFFALLYSLLGVPIARYAERANRISIVAIGAALWSAMTVACGVAQNFAQLALARVGVGIGEAACVPPSHSLISDYFPAERRASALAVFALGVPIGSMMAAVGGGWLVQNVDWRAAFWLLGAPGIALAVALKLTVREPPRSGVAQQAPKFGEALKALAGKSSFWHAAFGGALVSFFGYSTAQFTVSFFVRVHGLEIAPASYAFGAIAGIAVALGTFLGGFLGDRLSHRHPRVLAWLPALGVALALPAYFLGYIQSDFTVALVFFMFASVLHYLYLGPIFAVAQGVAEPRVRATASAIMVLILNLIGYGLGPATAGALSDMFANQALAPQGLSAGACAQMIAEARGMPLPNSDYWGAFMSWIGGQPAPAPQRYAIPEGADISSCAAAGASGLRQAMMVMASALAWAAVHFVLAGRTLVRDRVG